MHKMRMNLLIVTIGCLCSVAGCGSNEATGPTAKSLFDKGQFAEAIRACEVDIRDSNDPETVYQAQLIKARSLVNLAAEAQKRGRDDEANDMLEQAIAVLGTVIEFREEPFAFYQRAIAHELLGDADAAYRDRTRGKELDPQYKAAFTNEFRRDVAPPEQDEESNSASDSLALESKNKRQLPDDEFAQSDPFDPENDEFEASHPEGDLSAQPSDESTQRTYADRARGRDIPRTVDRLDPYKSLTSRKKNALESEEDNESSGPLTRRSGDEDDSDQEKSKPERTLTNRTPSPGAQRLPWQSPLIPRSGPVVQSPSLLPAPTTGLTGNLPPRLPTTVTGPTTGYFDPTPQVAPSPPGLSVPTTGIPTTPAPGLPYRGTAFRSQATPSSSVPSVYPNGPGSSSVGFTGALPYKQRAQLGINAARITTPYQAPPSLPDPYASVPRAPTLKDFYAPQVGQPMPIPTTSSPFGDR